MTINELSSIIDDCWLIIGVSTADSYITNRYVCCYDDEFSTLINSDAEVTCVAPTTFAEEHILFNRYEEQMDDDDSSLRKRRDCIDRLLAGAREYGHYILGESLLFVHIDQ